MKKFLKFLLICVFLIASSIVGYSQDNDTMETDEYYEEDLIVDETIIYGEEGDQTEYAYGEVVKVDKENGTITISEYSWDENEEVEITYTLKVDAVLEGVDDVDGILQGSYVDLEYMVDENGNKIAEYIVFYSDEE